MKLILFLARWNIAKAYQALDDEEEAFQIYQDLAKDLSENPEFLHDYAYILAGIWLQRSGACNGRKIPCLSSR